MVEDPKEKDNSPFDKEVQCYMANGTKVEGTVTGNSIEIGGKVFLEVIPLIPKSMLISLTRKFAWVQADQLVVIAYEEHEEVEKLLVN